LSILRGLELDAAGEVAERLEPALKCARSGRSARRACRWSRSKLVDAFHVWTEPGADRLEVADQLPGLEVRRPVEGHVLEHVREAALIVGLVYRARLDDEPKIRHGSRDAEWADEIGQAPLGSVPVVMDLIERQRR
jgi:hypothetical protein